MTEGPDHEEPPARRCASCGCLEGSRWSAGRPEQGPQVGGQSLLKRRWRRHVQDQGAAGVQLW